MSIFDTLLEDRKVIVTKDDASKSKAGMIAYLMSHGAESNTISRIIYSLSKDERNTLLDELMKLLPYVIDEDQFFSAFKHVVHSNNAMKYIRLDFWEFDLMECYDYLSQEGYDSIIEDFEKECNERLKTMKDRWE